MYLLCAVTDGKFGTLVVEFELRQFVQFYFSFIFPSCTSPPFWVYLPKVMVELPSSVCKCLT